MWATASERAHNGRTGVAHKERMYFAVVCSSGKSKTNAVAVAATAAPRPPPADREREEREGGLPAGSDVDPVL